MRWIVFFLCVCASLHAKRVEIFEDWNPALVGDASFEKPQQWTKPSWPHYYLIRLAFEKKGYAVRHWDLAAHRPWILTWKQVHGWKDFQHWLGWGLPRNNPIDDETAFVFFTGIGPDLRDLDLKRLPKEKLILFIWEPATVQPEPYDLQRQEAFYRIYTYDDELVDNVHFFKFYLPYLTFRIDELVPYEERKFLVLIASRYKSKYARELYSEREKLVLFFDKKPEEPFDLYGRYWKNKKFKNRWKGTIPDKMQVLKNYRFAIAYENSRINRYITEKLWDCFAAGVVPIYWGGDNITDYVPADCFIDRRQFKDDSEMLAFLKAMTQAEWEGYVQRAGEFLQSDMAQRFTDENYARQMAEAVN
ncbi:MAG: putative fucosyl transferase [Parachlamydiales bacterium]|nr:putative fucosyl transferase [Parachlamydiales bacterium]